MKKWKCFFAEHELWKYFSGILKLWKHKKFCLQNMNYEDMKIFVCNTQFMKTWKYLFAKHEF